MALEPQADPISQALSMPKLANLIVFMPSGGRVTRNRGSSFARPPATSSAARVSILAFPIMIDESAAGLQPPIDCLHLRLSSYR